MFLFKGGWFGYWARGVTLLVCVKDIACMGDGCGGEGGVHVGLSVLIYPLHVVLELIGFVSPFLVHLFKLQPLEPFVSVGLAIL